MSPLDISKPAFVRGRDTRYVGRTDSGLLIYTSLAGSTLLVDEYGRNEDGKLIVTNRRRTTRMRAGEPARHGETVFVLRGAFVEPVAYAGRVRTVHYVKREGADATAIASAQLYTRQKLEALVASARAVMEAT